MSWQARVLNGALRNTYKRYYARRHQLGPNDVIAARKRLAVVAALLPPAPRGMRRARFNADGVGGEVSFVADKADARTVLYLHGGAYAVGTAKLFRELSWRLARASAARVYTPDYRLAPEAPFPAALDDALRVWQWLRGEGVNMRRLIIAGDSAGGGLALALSLRLRDQGLPLPRALVCLSPWTDLSGSGESTRSNADSDPFVVAHLMVSVARMYAAEAALDDPALSPLFADLSGLPPMLVQASRSEVLLSDAERLVNKALSAGVDAQLETWADMPHVFQHFARIVPEAREAIGNIGAYVDEKCPLPHAQGDDVNAARPPLA